MVSKGSPVFKGPSGRYYLKYLFYETTMADKSTVVYTLKDQDHQGFPSLYRLYMQEADPTEYRFATNHLGGWAHWEQLCGCSWFKPHIDQWRRELALKIQSEALVNIFVEADNANSKNRFQANKYLIEQGWVSKGSQAKGRPTKAQIKEEAILQAKDKGLIEEDFERLLN